MFVLGPSMESSSHAVPSSFHPGHIGTYGTYVREGESEMGHSTRFGRDDTQNVTCRDNKRPKERLQSHGRDGRNLSNGSWVSINWTTS
jgi:hypothetical protein